jgi:apolipoprotein N-acyltransferase
MAGSGGRVAGIVSIVISVMAAVAGVLNLTSKHPRRGLAFLIACGVLLILGIILVVISGRKSTQAPVQ